MRRQPKASPPASEFVRSVARHFCLLVLFVIPPLYYSKLMRLLKIQISVIKMWYYHKNFDRSSLVQTQIPGGFAELLQSILRTNDSFSSLIGSCLEHHWTTFLSSSQILFTSFKNWGNSVPTTLNCISYE